MAAYDAIGLHCYGPIADEWNGSGRLARMVDKLQLLGLGDKPRHVTEVNQVTFALFLAFASVLGIESAYWFLWRSAGPDHRAWDLVTPYIEGLKEYIAEEGETPMPNGLLSGQFPTQYQKWIEAGGDPEGDFRRHLLGLGELLATQEAFGALCEQGKSVFEQAKQVGLRLPK